MNAVVTGGASGISLEVAKSLCKNGARTVILDVNEKRAREAIEQFEDAGFEMEFEKIDLTNESEVATVFSKIKERLKHIDILFNGAGIMDSDSMKNTPLSVFRKVLDVNLFGSYNAMSSVIGQMVERNFGRIVNVTSAYANGVRNAIGYTASKGAISSLTKSLAAEMHELGVDVTVNAISPPATDTELWRRTRSPEVIEKHRTEKDIAMPSDLVDAVLVLCSKEAHFISGEIIGFKQALSKVPNSRA